MKFAGDARSKYNVSMSDVESRTYDGITFDSKLEMRFYRDVVTPLWRSGEITYYELQKKYTLQPSFTHQGKTVRAIEYVADFYIEYASGLTEVIDTKGCPDSVAKMKRKMFLYKFPTLTFRWIGYVKKYGGWLDYEEIHHRRLEDKKRRKAAKAAEEKEL